MNRIRYSVSSIVGACVLALATLAIAFRDGRTHTPGPEAKAGSAAGVVFNEPHVDLGRKKKGPVIEHEFRFRVGGRSPVYIDDVRESCGCLKAKIDPKQYQPGDTGKIILAIHSMSQQDGPHRYQLTLVLRDPIERTVRLTADVTFESEIVVAPASLLVYHNGKEGLQQTISVMDRRPRPLAITELISSSKQIRPTLVTTPAADQNSNIMQVAVWIADDFPVGKSEERICVRTNDPDYPVLEIPVTVVRSNVVSVYPESLHVRLNAQMKEPVHRQLLLRHRAGSALRIAEVECDLPGIRIDWSSNPSKIARIRVVIDRESNDGPARAVIRIRLTDPEALELQVPLELD